LTRSQKSLEMEQKTKAEAELLQDKKIEALGQVTRGIAHDFNNVLAILRGSLEALSGRQSEERLQARVAVALETIKRGEKLLAQLGAFARRQPHSAIRVDINDRLRRMTKLLARTVGSAVAIETDLASDLSLVDMDPTDFELAILNLVSNSRDAMPGGGLLRIRTANSGPSQKAPASRAEESVQLEISETGTGMPQEVVARAFEPFFTTKKPGNGTGLGLTIVCRFARQTGGMATIRSEVGRGTTVTLRLRCSRE
jgi:signal transduction histidine kinase